MNAQLIIWVREAQGCWERGLGETFPHPLIALRGYEEKDGKEAAALHTPLLDGLERGILENSWVVGKIGENGSAATQYFWVSTERGRCKVANHTKPANPASDNPS